MNEINFCFYELRSWMEIYKNDSNFIMFNPINEMFLLFEIEDWINKLIKSFHYDDIKFNF